MLNGLRDGNPEHIASAVQNDLEQTAFSKFPLLEIIRDEMLKAGALAALLTGTGATIFGLARNEAHAREVADRLRAGLDCPLWMATAKTVDAEGN